MRLPMPSGSEFTDRVHRRLAEDQVAWLVTVDPGGMPQPSPVWFLPDGDTLLIYSRPGTVKVRNIVVRPGVAVHLDADPDGDNIVILTGTAAIDPAAPAANCLPAYLAKYARGIAAIGMTPESFAAEYSVAVRVTPEAVRGH